MIVKQKNILVGMKPNSFQPILQKLLMKHDNKMVKNEINVEHDINIHLEDKKISRHFFLFLFLLYAGVYMTKNCFSAALADIVTDGVLTKTQTGFITAMFYIVYAPFQILGGFVADRYSPYLLLKIGLIGGAIANTVIFFNHNYYVMLITWTLNAVIQFALWPSIYKIISSQLCRSDSNTMLFLISLAATFGLLINYVVAAIMPSWEYNFALSAFILIGFSIALHFYDKRLGHFMKPDKRIESLPDNKRNKSKKTFALLFQSGFLLLLIPCVIRGAVSQGVQTMSPILLVETFGISPSLGNLFCTLVIIFGVAGTLIAKIVLAPMLKNDIAGMLTLFLIAPVFAIILAFLPGLPTTMVMLCILSAILTAALLFITYFNAKFVKYGMSGTAAGISNFGTSIGFIISSYGTAAIADNFDWSAVLWVWVVMLIVNVASTVGVFFMNKHFNRKENSK